MAIIIEITGIHVSGRSTQIRMLKRRLEKIGCNVITQKYPYYECLPTGQIINDYLHSGNPWGMTPTSFQLICVANALDQEAKRKFPDDAIVLIEDYSGANIAWGAASGVDRQLLIELNKKVRKADLSILLEGTQYLTKVKGKNKNGHIHEKDRELTLRAENEFRVNSFHFKWVRIDNRQTARTIHKKVVKAFCQQFPQFKERL